MAQPHRLGKDGFLDEKQLALVETASGLGLSATQIGALLGVGKTQFYEYIKRDPELAERLKGGRAKASFKVSQALYNKATSGDVNAIRWWEMTREKRAERSEQKVTNKTFVVGVPDAKDTSAEWEKAADDHVSAVRH